MKVLIVGRDASCDIELNDAKVSRQHLQIVMNDGGQMSVIDLNSTNGTYVNGSRIKGECKVTPKDILKVGDTVITWDLVLQKLNGGAPIPQAQRPAATPNNKPKNDSNKKSSKTLVIIIVAAVILLGGGGVAWYLVDQNNKNKEIEEAKAKEEQQDFEEVKDELMTNYRTEVNGKKEAQDKLKSVNQKLKDETQAKNQALQDNEALKRRNDSINKAAQKANEDAEAEKRNANAANARAEQAQAEADSLRAEAEKAKQEADSIAKAQSEAQAQAQNDMIIMMDETLDSKIDALSKKDQKAVADLLGIKDATDKNAKELIRAAFNDAKNKNEFDKMKQIYDSVKNGDQKARDAEKDKLVGDLYERYKVAIYGFNKDHMKIVADSLGIEGAKPTNAKSKIDAEIKHAKDDKNIERMQQIITVIEQVKQQIAPTEQPKAEGENNAEPQLEEVGNPDAKKENEGK